MASKVLFALFFLFSLEAFGQTLPSSLEIEEVIKAKVSDSTDLILYTPVISKRILTWRQTQLVYGESRQSHPFSIYNKGATVFLDTILTAEDKNYIRLQVDSFSQKEWTIKDIKYISQKDSLEKAILLSLPLFSKNKEYAIINQLSISEGRAVNTFVTLYRKTNGKWVYYRYILGGLF